jgi:hypothetical protein
VDRAMIERHLAQAERHIAEGERRIERQREIIAALERDGHDTIQARAPMVNFEEVLRTHIADRDLIRNQLKNARRT